MNLTNIPIASPVKELIQARKEDIKKFKNINNPSNTNNPLLNSVLIIGIKWLKRQHN